MISEMAYSSENNSAKMRLEKNLRSAKNGRKQVA